MAPRPPNNPSENGITGTTIPLFSQSIHFGSLKSGSDTQRRAEVFLSPFRLELQERAPLAQGWDFVWMPPARKIQEELAAPGISPLLAAPLRWWQVENSWSCFIPAPKSFGFVGLCLIFPSHIPVFLLADGISLISQF